MPEWTEQAPWPQNDCDAIDSGTTAWLMTSTALVLFMTPGLAFFYGGLVHRKSVVVIMMQCIISMGLIGIVWPVIGFSLAFGQSGGGFIGNPNSFFMLWNLDPCTPVGFPMHHETANFPGLLFAGFQMTFAIICPAIITGAFVDRVRFECYLVFIVAWLLAVYCPFAHWIWNPEGFLNKWGVKDFAGGIVVHVSAGFAALASVAVVGQRKYSTEEEREAADTPHNRAFVALGTGMLWFGWFGNTGGSALNVDGIAVFAIVNTCLSCSTAMIAWVLIEWCHLGKPTMVGACVGAVVGLVVIPPCAGFVRPWAALLLGGLGSCFCYAARLLGHRFKYDDALDVCAVHGVGGALGTILLGVLADESIGGQARGAEFLGKQVGATALCAAYSFGVSYAILKAVDYLTPGGIRPSDADVQRGLDLSMHGEHAYAEDAVKVFLAERADLEPDKANAFDARSHRALQHAVAPSRTLDAPTQQALDRDQTAQLVSVRRFAQQPPPIYYPQLPVGIGVAAPTPFQCAA